MAAANSQGGPADGAMAAAKAQVPALKVMGEQLWGKLELSGAYFTTSGTVTVSSEGPLVHLAMSMPWALMLCMPSQCWDICQHIQFCCRLI